MAKNDAYTNQYDPTSYDPTTQTTQGSPYTPIPGAPNQWYDPQTGQVYSNPGGTAGYVPGADYALPGMSYNPTSGQLSVNGQPYGANPNYAPPSTIGDVSNPNSNFWNPVGTTPDGGGGGAGGSGGSGGGSYGTIGQLLQPFNETFNGSFYTFTPPTYTPPPAFAAPSYAEAANDPGYQFMRDQALGAIRNDAAARGLFASGATGKALEDYATNLANTHYNDVYNRALGTYMTNYATQYTDPYKFGYQGAFDAAASKQRASELDYQKFMDDYTRYLGQKQFQWNVLQPFALG